MSLDRLPDEIFRHCLCYVSPDDNLASLQLVSRRLYRLANEPLIWKYHCRSSFKYWDPKHEFPRKLRQRVSRVNWKQLFIRRKHTNLLISRNLDRGIKSKVGRIKNFEEICKHGYDAKDYLLNECCVDESADDYLARSYWSKSVLNGVHRVIAIEEWHKLRVAAETSTLGDGSRLLERVLGAFDMFVLYDQPGDIHDITQMLDEMTSRFLKNTPNFKSMKTREKALVLNHWLRVNNLTGLRDPERDYRNLRNCLIGQALRHDEHESLPIISSAIYCCIAERLDIEAQCCAFPSHVHVVVLSKEGKDLDDVPVPKTKKKAPPRDRMYLDPYGSQHETPVYVLEGLLERFGWQTSPETFLSPVSPLSVGIRTAHNIKATLTTASELGVQANPALTRLLVGHDGVNMKYAHYAALWATLLLSPINGEWKENLEALLSQFIFLAPEDTWLVEKYLCPLWDRLALVRPPRYPVGLHRGMENPHYVTEATRRLDPISPETFVRNKDGNRDVTFKVGQVFRHRRYRWLGVITGWTDQGTRQLPIPQAVALDETLSDTDLPMLVPRPETFYTSLRPTGEEQNIVAEDNIELVRNPYEIPENLFMIAGKFFLRFDRENCKFVSNLLDQYPLD